MGRSGDGSPPDAEGKAEHAATGKRWVSASRVSGRLVGLAVPGIAGVAEMASETMDSAGPGGYRFEPETVAALISRREDVLHGLRSDQKVQEAALGSAQPPAPDPPAVQQARLAQASLQRMIDYNVSVRGQAYAYVNALKKANGTYIRHDADVADALGKVNPGSPTPGGMDQ